MVLARSVSSGVRLTGLCGVDDDAENELPGISLNGSNAAEFLIGLTVCAVAEMATMDKMQSKQRSLFIYPNSPKIWFTTEKIIERMAHLTNRRSRMQARRMALFAEN